LGFGFVSAQLQAAAGMLLRQSLAKTQKSSLKTATLFLKTLQRGACPVGRQDFVILDRHARGTPVAQFNNPAQLAQRGLRRNHR
jgi:hypothetical protein